jgi:Ni/Fe-hydrogenase subunit HybB-like protein
MWLERFLIVVPPLEHKYLPYDWGSYRPTWVEITITVGTLMGMILMYVLFAKFVPIISIWELKGGRHAKQIAEQVNAPANPAAILLDGTLPSTNS